MWKVHLRAGSGGGESEKWFQIQDLIVEEIRKEMIFLGETVIQVSRLTIYLLAVCNLYCRYGSVVQNHQQTTGWISTLCSVSQARSVNGHSVL